MPWRLGSASPVTPEESRAIPSLPALLIELAGEAALLLYGLHLVQRGIERAFGARLRAGLSAALRDRGRAFAAGLAATAVLQSSTAVGLMLARFQARGAIGLVPAMAALLGANLGTALIVQLLSFDLHLLFPLLVLAGWAALRRGRRARTRDLGRAAIGLGLMLGALRLLLDSVHPLEASVGAGTLLDVVSGTPVAALLLGLAAAWAMHASLAAVLLAGSLAAAGGLGAEATIAMVAGANLGGAIPPLLAARAGRGGTDPAALRLPVANLLNRALGAGVALLLLPELMFWLARIDPAPARLAANAHLAFNAATALVFLPLLEPLAAALRRLLPPPPPEADPAAPRYLDEAALATPAVALANAEREVLRLADMVEAMLRGCAAALARPDRDAARAVGRLDDGVDRLHRAVHAYLARLPEDSLGEAATERLAALRGFAIALENCGDIADRGLARHAARLARRGVALGGEEAERLALLQDRLVAQLRLAVAVFLNGDADAARDLVRDKEAWRGAEREAARRMVAQGDDPSSAAGLALDVVRDLKRIAAQLVAVAHPLLEREGALRGSRLRPVPRA